MQGKFCFHKGEAMKKVFNKCFIGMLFAALILFAKVDASANSGEVEPNNTMDKATLLVNDAFTSGNLMDGDDVDYYKIVIPQDGRVNISFKHEYIDTSSYVWNVKMYDAQRHEYTDWDYSGNVIETITTPNMGLAAGTYYLEVDDLSFYDNPYSIKYSYMPSSEWEKEFNERYDEATLMSNNTIMNGNLMKSEDKDFYKIVLPQDGSMKFSFGHTYIETGSYIWRVKLYDANLHEFVDWEYAGNVIETIVEPGIGLPAGTYYIEVSSLSAYDENYQIKYSYTASDAWEKERNELFNTASDLTIDTYINGNTMTSDDIDFYKIVLPSNAYISLSFMHDYEDTRSSCWEAYLLDSSLRELSDWDYYGNDPNENSTPNMGLFAGTYYIKVRSTSWTDVNYKLKVSQAVPVSSIEIKGVTGAYVGESAQLTAYVLPENATDKTVTWSSSDTSVATIDNHGVIKCIKSGTTTVKAKANDGSEAVGSMVFTVKDKPATEEKSSIVKKATIKKVSSKGKKVKVTWKKLNSADKYEVQIATDKKFTNNLKKAKVKGNMQKASIKYKKRGTVYIRVRGIDRFGKFGAWSKVKKFKIK